MLILLRLLVSVQVKKVCAVQRPGRCNCEVKELYRPASERTLHNGLYLRVVRGGGGTLTGNHECQKTPGCELK